MRFDLERHAEPVADVDDAGVLFSRLRQDVLPVTGEHLEQRAAVLVAAVLRPERAKHPQLDLVRLAVKQVDDALVLFEGERKLRQRPGIGGHRSQDISRRR